MWLFNRLGLVEDVFPEVETNAVRVASTKAPIPRSPYHWQPKPKAESLQWELLLDGAVRRHRISGREVCEPNAAGWRLYASRVREMVQRQNYRCIRDVGPLTDQYSLTSDWDNQWLTGGLEADVITEAHLDQASILAGIERFARDREDRLARQRELLDRV